MNVRDKIQLVEMEGAAARRRAWQRHYARVKNVGPEHEESKRSRAVLQDDLRAINDRTRAKIRRLVMGEDEPGQRSAVG